MPTFIPFNAKSIPDLLYQLNRWLLDHLKLGVFEKLQVQELDVDAFDISDKVVADEIWAKTAGSFSYMRDSAGNPTLGWDRHLDVYVYNDLHVAGSTRLDGGAYAPFFQPDGAAGLLIKDGSGDTAIEVEDGGNVNVTTPLTVENLHVNTDIICEGACAVGTGAAGLLTAGHGIEATAGDIVASAGAVSAGTTVTAGTGLTVTSGGATVTAGDLTITAGELKGCRQTFAFVKGSVTADAYMAVGAQVCTATYGQPMSRAGSIASMAVCMVVTSHTDGATVQFQSRVNDSIKLTLTTDPINDNGTITPTPVTAARNTHTFTAGQYINPYMDVTGTVGFNVIVTIEVVYDS